MKNRNWLTLTECAGILNVGKRRVRKYILSGDLDTHKGCIKIPALMRFVSDRKQFNPTNIENSIRKFFG